ncbi:MAG: (Na+)-NQR maturation NqrM [Porticoccaceae bacterium]|nr:(Na+)-NQR maturation NqrM [Porticoccaceae bacterium]
MLEILFAVIGFVVLISIMAIGVLLGKKPISGSCGGVAAALGEDDYTCEICGDDPNKCDENRSNTSKPLYKNASNLKDKE